MGQVYLGCLWVVKIWVNLPLVFLKPQINADKRRWDKHRYMEVDGAGLSRLFVGGENLG
jgi:hypothetical protein